MLRAPDSPGPSPLTRLIALVILVGLVAVSAPVLFPVAHWVVALL